MIALAPRREASLEPRAWRAETSAPSAGLTSQLIFPLKIVASRAALRVM
jgi:hypothetical protein